MYELIDSNIKFLLFILYLGSLNTLKGYLSIYFKSFDNLLAEV